MTIVSHAHQFVVGVDTHAKNHVYAIIDATTGEHLDTRDFPTSIAGIKRHGIGLESAHALIPMSYG